MAAFGRPSMFPRAGGVRAGLLTGLLAIGLQGCGDTLYEPTTPPPGNGNGNGDPPPGTPAIQATLQVEAPDRIELTDSIVLRVSGWDEEATSPIDSLAYTAVVRTVPTGEEQTFRDRTSFHVFPGDTVSAVFVLRPTWLGPADLPSTFHLEVYGLAYDSTGVCAAAVADSQEVFRCEERLVAGAVLTVGSVKAADIPVQVVRGRTTVFPSNPLVVGDLVVDTLRERAYVSNRLSNRLHVFRPTTFAWDADVSVGSEPWGLHVNAPGDTLLVANSGGTSVTHVALAGAPHEVVSRRLQTRNTPLFEIDLEIVKDSLPDGTEVADTLTDAVRFFDFSDRPQYVAKDALGRILYSTRPTFAAPRGTVRVIENQAGWEEPETRILARIPLDVTKQEETVTVLHADSVVPYWGGLIEVWDHRPGFPSQVLQSGIQRPMDALRAISENPNSDVEWLLDSAWQLEAVSFADTTYVAVSRDRNRVAFGDGGEPDVGRIVLWHAPTGTISQRLTVADLVNNASERVRALELNRDGSLGIARGSFGTYFFSNDLRLRGTVPEGIGGGGGAALHPDHPNTPAPQASSAQTLAFTFTGDRTVRILDTVHYGERGRISLRDPIAGALRVTPPLPSDNNGQGRSCSGAACVVAKVFAVTEGGGIVVVDVFASDIQTLP